MLITGEENSASLENQDRPLQPGLAAGDPAAHQVAYDLYGPALFRTAVRILGSQADAEDAVQDVLVSLVRSRERIGNVENLGAYLFVALRRAANRIHRHRRKEPLAGLNEVCISDRNKEAEDPAEAEALRRAVQRLPVEQREVLVRNRALTNDHKRGAAGLTVAARHSAA